MLHHYEALQCPLRFRRERLRNFDIKKDVNYYSYLLQSGKEDARGKKVSPTGGYCYKASRPKESGGRHMTDKSLSVALADILSNEAVASFGDGAGTYKSLIEGTGKVKVYDAFDGAPYVEEVTNGSVKFLDLSAPQYGLKAYGWIVCIEVAEHIPRQYEAVFLS